MDQQTSSVEVDEQQVTAPVDNESPETPADSGTSATDYEQAGFDTLKQDTPVSGEAADGNLGLILDVPITLSMELGRTSVTIQQLLGLAQGSVVELDRAAGEPLDILVNGTLIAKGEVVIVNEKFGIRLIDVISRAERVSKLA